MKITRTNIALVLITLSIEASSCERSGSKNVDPIQDQNVNPVLILKLSIESTNRDFDFIFSQSSKDSADISKFSEEKNVGCFSTSRPFTLYYDPSLNTSGTSDWLELCSIQIPAVPCDTKLLKIRYNWGASVSATCEVVDKI